MIVQFKEGVSEETAREVVARHQASVTCIWNIGTGADRFGVSVHLTEGKDEDQAIEEFEAEPTVEYAERAVIRRPAQ
ncbi:MAG: hypothetical protein KKF41_11985 [Actinobacteria bacterium]|nr:hypothetical protein [Actinomycetota bacterium]MBU1944310.1 hypothetical protein [Actinomycetota bacterium]MBU2688295.1 hypothetical protein [Actinomycetota bacterium]